MTTRILFAGLDNAGKSTFVCSLAVHLRLQGYAVGLHEIDPWSDSHQPILGAKPWAERAKKRFGEVGDDEYSALVHSYINDDAEVVLGDLHGRIQEPLLHQNSNVLASATTGAVLFNRADRVANVNVNHPQSIPAWEEFFGQLGLGIVSRVYSLQTGELPQAGHINAAGLDRALQPYHPALPQLAQVIVQSAAA